jgi:NRE family putative nickel resistance protein-like MFS transporter
MTNPFKPLSNKIFLRLYFSETISLLGDAFTWVGIALLAYQFGGKHSALILSTALTLRVAAFILFGPLAGVLADRIDRKKILYFAHFIRMAIVGCLPFVNAIWQIYVLMFLLNVFNAFFTPAYKAAVPQTIHDQNDYSKGIALSNATYQILGILGPGLAGAVAAWLGAREIFFVDAASFIIAGVLILSLPSLMIEKKKSSQPLPNVWKDILKGSRLLFQNKAIRFALFIELVSAIAGAQILVNTVGYVKGALLLTNKHYGYVMAAFGIGASIAAFASGILDKTKNRIASLLIGAVLVCLSIVFANYVLFFPLLILWLFAGFGQTLTEMPSQILIAEKISLDEQGKVYGAHFAWSHLWWAFAYPIAGFSGTNFGNFDFLIGACIAIILFIFFLIFLRPDSKTRRELHPVL